MKTCPFCAEDIQDAALVCRFCGADLQAGTRSGAAPTVVVHQPSGPSAGVAAVLSLIIPGAGQMYAGHVAAGLIWLVFVIIGYLMFILPGLVLHVICIASAASTAREAATASRPAAQPPVA